MRLRGDHFLPLALLTCRSCAGCWAVAPVVEHLAYGITTVATYDWLRRR